MSKSVEYNTFKLKGEGDKAVNEIKGILKGINIDGEVNEDEIRELDAWCERHQDITGLKPFSEFLHKIRQAIREDVSWEEAVEEMYWLSQKYEGNYYTGVTADLQTLQGVCHGILADGVVNENEVKELSEWLELNTHLRNYYPYAELRTVLLRILKDGVVDEDESIYLKRYFYEFVNLTDKELETQIGDEVAGVKIQSICTYDPDIKIQGKNYCVTGELSRYTRKEFAQAIEDNGGYFQKNPTKETDYLIVGADGNELWAYACYGKKVEHALNLRRKGAKITLVHEFDFFDVLDDLTN